MLTVEQVKNLDEKVRMALDLIESLKSENSMLKAKLDEYKQRVGQLESVVEGFKLEQLEIEEGIKDVLTQLDELEDQITDPSPSTPVSAPAADIQAVPSTPASEPVIEQPIVASPVTEQTSEAEKSADVPSVQTPELEIF